MQAKAQAFDPVAAGFDPMRLSRLDASMEAVVKSGRVPGLSFILMRHGKVIDQKAFGLADVEAKRPMADDTIARIYSMTKPITGVAMMILFEQGKWRLDDPVTRYIPEFKNLKVITGLDDKGQPILVAAKRPPTMREVMSHTAGFGYGLLNVHPVDKMIRDKKVMSSNSIKEMVDKIAEIPLMYQPGEGWTYSVAVDVQGYIVEKLSGQTLGQFMADNIFKPLKMIDTGFQTGTAKASRLAQVYAFNRTTGTLEIAKDIFSVPMENFVAPPAMQSGGGGLVSTLGDYVRFAQMLANGGELDGIRILSPRTVQMMMTNVAPDGVPIGFNATSSSGVANTVNHGVGFGLDAQVMIDPLRSGSLVGKNTMSWGGAGGTWSWADPTYDIVFVGFTQSLGEDLANLTRTLTYQALLHPEK